MTHYTSLEGDSSLCYGKVFGSLQSCVCSHYLRPRPMRRAPPAAQPRQRSQRHQPPVLARKPRNLLWLTSTPPAKMNLPLWLESATPTARRSLTAALTPPNETS